MMLFSREDANIQHTTVQEIPLVVDKVRFYKDDTGFIILTVKWSNELEKLFPKLDLGVNQYNYKDNTSVGVKGKLGYRPAEGETIIGVGLSVAEQSKEYGTTLEAKQLYAERLSSFDENGNVILNEKFTNFDNLSSFLSTTCKTKNLGKTTLIKILEKVSKHLNLSEFDTIKTLTECVQRGEEDFIEKISNAVTVKQLESLKKLHNAWAANLHVQNLLNQLFDFGFSQSEADKIIKHFGNGAVEILKKNPYEAIAVGGIGWSKADLLGQKVGISPTDPRRIISGIEAYYRETTMNSGDTLLPARETFKILAQEKFRLQPSEYRVLQNYMTKEFEKGERYRLYPFLDKNNEQVNYFTNRNDWDNESFIAKKLVELNTRGRQFSKADLEKCSDIINKQEKLRNGTLVTLDPSQIKAIYTCLSQPVSLLTGGAGCGKTTILKRLIECACRLGMKVMLCSPTGKAAKRMTESVDMNGIVAQTIHSTLRYKSKSSDEKVKSGQADANSIFEHHRHNPLAADWIFVDESSMTDIYLAKSLLDAIAVGARVTFIGDPNQLPSVQKGCFFFDIIDSGAFATGKLTVTHRQANGNDINDVAHAILKNDVKALDLKNRRNVYYRSYDALLDPAQGGTFSQSELNHKIVEDLTDDYAKLVKQFGIENVQVLTPARQKHNPLSSEALNLQLRARIMHTHEKGFVKGDRVIGMKNNKVFRNGEMGTVVFIDKLDKILSVLFDGENEPKNCFNEQGSLTYAYAITTHKSQGSECKHVLIPMSMSDVFMLNRNWFYTAVTRGKEMVYLYGQRKAIAMSVFKQSTRRKTTLRYLLKGAKAIKPSTKVANAPKI